MQVIVGPRQVGKSTLIGQVLEVCNMPYDSYSADDVVGASADWLAGVWQTARMRMDIRGEGKRLLVVRLSEAAVRFRVRRRGRPLHSAGFS